MAVRDPLAPLFQLEQGNKGEAPTLFRPTRLLPAALIIGLVALLTVLMAAIGFGVPVGVFTRDLNTLCAEAGANLPPYAGALGLFILMIWASCASLAFLVAVLLPEMQLWLLNFGALVCVLAADDALSLHEEVGPALGIPEVAFYLVYAILGLYLSLVLAKRMWLTRRIDPATMSFLLGGLFLSISVLVDQAFYRQHLAEDAPKLLGALVWLTVPLLCLRADIVDRLVSRAEDSGYIRPVVP